MYRMFLVVGLMVGVLRAQEQTPDHRLRTATTVLHEILSAPDKGIPEDLLAKAQCVMIVPGLKKGAFIVGGIRSRVRVLPPRRAVGWSRRNQAQRWELWRPNRR